ncbi:hypothetical protein L9F63_022424, partial [Diploptera punctata]
LDDNDAESDEERVSCAAAEKNYPAHVIDLRKHLSTLPREYSYFRDGALDLWAGPSHWKIRPSKHTSCGADKSIDGRKQKSKQNNKDIIDFQQTADISVSIEEEKSFKLNKQTLERVWNAEKNTYPCDLHYDSKYFQELKFRKLIGISTDPVPLEDDQRSHHDNDTENNCPDVDMVNDAAADVDADDDGFCVEQHQDIHNNLFMEGMSPTNTFTGDNLVIPPNKVPRIFLPYAQRAKQIDMKKLKAAMWNILVNVDKDVNELQTLKMEKPVKFSHVYSILPSRLPLVLAENLTAGLVLVALLQLSNEKLLHIEGQINLDDMTISQD